MTWGDSVYTNSGYTPHHLHHSNYFLVKNQILRTLFFSFSAQSFTGSLRGNVSTRSADAILVEKNNCDFLFSLGYVKQISSPKCAINICFTLRLLTVYQSRFSFKISRHVEMAYPFVSMFSWLIICLKASSKSLSVPAYSSSPSS